MEIQNGSFAELYENSGRKVETHSGEKSGLMCWFDRVYSLPFSSFTVEDLARSCRQNLFPEYIVPRTLSVLATHPLAGVLYDGELFDSLPSVEMPFWQEHPYCCQSLIEIFNRSRATLAAEFEEWEFINLERFVNDVENIVVL